MNGRLPRRPVERYGDHAGASGINVAHAPCGRYGGLACRGGRYGGLTCRGGRYGGLTLQPRPPVLLERYGGLAPLCDRSCLGTPV